MTVVEFLEKAPFEAWIGFVGVLCGGLIAVFSSWLAGRASLRQLERQLAHGESLSYKKLRRERLEELYILVCYWQAEFIDEYSSLILVMKGVVDYNQHLDNLINKDRRGVEFNRIQMIFDVYGLALRESYEAILAVRADINVIHGAHKQSYKRGEDGIKYIAPTQEAQLRLGAAFDRLKNDISDAARD